jgi:hypothetical protein
MTTSKKKDPRLERAMRDSLKAYSTGNKKFFDYLRDDGLAPEGYPDTESVSLR